MIRALAAALLLASPLHAQLPIPGLKPAGAAPAAAAPATPEQTRAQLQQQLKTARERFNRLDEAASRLPEGVTAVELADRRRDAQQAIVSLERQLKMLAAKPQSAELAKKAAEARDAWTGFKEAPPYSVLMVDDLRNQRDVAAEKQATTRSSLQLLERSLEELRGEAKAADDAQRLAATRDLKEPAAAWRLDAAGERATAITARLGALETTIDLQRDALAEADAKLALIDRKLQETAGRQELRDEDLEKVRATSQGRESAVRKEIKSVQERADALAKLAVKQEAEAAAPDAGEAAKLRYETTQERVDALTSTVESLNLLNQLESAVPEAYEHRRVLMTSADANAREDAVLAFQKRRERLQALAVLTTNGIASANAELRGLEARAANLPAGDPSLAALNDLRADLWDQLNATQRLAQTVELHQGQLGHWLEDFNAHQAKRSVGQRFGDGLKATWRQIVAVWNTPIWKFDGPDGRKGVINLGTLIRALLLFTFGYWIASHSTHRLQRYAVSHRHIAQAQAHTIRRWSMVLLSFLLALATLHVLEIPLTLFAFFGGALAIGIGFGTQTLIKNFISGIIVLFERNIRVGDILDIGGVVGTVTEINTRSSILRSGDGVETLIPNSVFLENKITNWTHSNRRLRRTVRVGVAYDSPIQTVVEVLVECAKRHGLVLDEPEPMALLEDFGPTALVFALNFWVELGEKTNAALVASDLRYMIAKRFGETGIVIPSPGSDMRLVTEAPLKVSVERSRESDG